MQIWAKDARGITSNVRKSGRVEEKRGGTMGELKVDFAIITAIELERQAICKAFGMGDKHKAHKGVHTYWRNRLELGNNQFSVDRKGSVDRKIF